MKNEKEKMGLLIKGKEIEGDRKEVGKKVEEERKRITQIEAENSDIYNKKVYSEELGMFYDAEISQINQQVKESER